MNKRTVYVVSYHHIDYSYPLTDTDQLARLVKVGQLPCSLESVRKAFLEAGWEGDGDIEAYWIPPFVFPDPDTYGIHLWHVKQSNNGTSWLCADQPYDFMALRDTGSDDWQAITVDEPVFRGVDNPEDLLDF